MSAVVEFGQMPQTTGDPPRVIAPERATIFSDRARRFGVLAQTHSLGDWLRLLGRLSQAQHAALQILPTPSLPDAAARESARQHGMPPVLQQNWARQALWREALVEIRMALAVGSPPAVQEHCRQLQNASAEALEAIADRVLRNELAGPESALLPYVAAALQVYWTALAVELGAARIPLLDVPGICPCCGSLPVASIVRTAPDVDKLRYLHCSLCNTEWHFVRVKCAACDATGKVSYRHIDAPDLAGAAAMRAEVCDDCKSYLKILYQDQALEGDPIADDLATLALDMLVDEAGYSRAGPNLFFVPGTS